MGPTQRPKRAYPALSRPPQLCIDSQLFGPSSLEKEMGRYVPRTKASQPAVGAKVFNTPYTQGKPTSTGTKSGRPLAVTATVKTTASRPKK